MVGNNSSGLVHYLAGRFPGQIGWLMSPGEFKEPRAWLPYGLDNGKFTCYTNKTEWIEDKFFELLDRCRLSKWKPSWVAVPDEIGDWRATESLWYYYETKLRRYGWPLAFVAQDGCTPSMVPKKADLVFVGGTTDWKWQNTALFAAALPRVHIGRVNWIDKLEYCERAGIESVDGTGFFRGGELSKQAKFLVDFLEGHRHHEQQPQLIE